MLTRTQAQYHREVLIPCGKVELPGTLELPEHPCGVVLFAHGSGGSRESPRNRLVAARLRSAGLGTVLFDLLTERDARAGNQTFNLRLLRDRLLLATHWAGNLYYDLPLGWFGASTGAGAALAAAAEEPDLVQAIVSCGGRFDLADPVLPRVGTPTLFIVGGDDAVTLELNRKSMNLLAGPTALNLIPGAGHLFEEGNSLDRAADFARHWFVRHLAGIGRHSLTARGR